jgi:hypothetical protein
LLLGGLAAAGVGAVMVGGAVSADASAPATASTAAGAQKNGAQNNVVALVRDARAGVVDIYVGDRHLHVRDRDLAARLVRAAR